MKNLIDQYKTRIDKYDKDKLSFIYSKPAINFRAYFNLIATYAQPKPLKRLNSNELKIIREYIKTKLNNSLEQQNANDSLENGPKASKLNDSTETTLDISILIQQQTFIAEQELNSLEENCNSLKTDTVTGQDLVCELKSFIDSAQQIINPELLVMGEDKERLKDLQEITDRIKENNAMILPILEAEKEIEMEKGFSQNSDLFPQASTQYSDNTDIEASRSDSEEESELNIIKKNHQ